MLSLLLKDRLALLAGIAVLLSGCGTLPETPAVADAETELESVESAAPAADLNLLENGTLGGAPGEPLPSYWPKYPLGVIGEIEPVYFEPFDEPFFARVDTGAETSSIDAREVKEFERDGKKWVSFYVEHPDTGERSHFECPVKRRLRIKRALQDERRVAVDLVIHIGKEVVKGEFTLSDREEFEYPVLLGRNIISGLALVDVSRSNTLK